MSALQLNLIRGDSDTLIVPLIDAGLPFNPANKILIFTAKNALSDTDAQAVFQHTSSSGAITTRFRNGAYEALVECVPTDTLAVTAAKNLYFDIQAQDMTSGAKTTANIGRLQIAIDVTINTTTSVTEYTSNPPIPGGGSAAAGSTNITNNTANVVVTFATNLANINCTIVAGVRKPNTAAEHLLGSVLDDSVAVNGFTYEFVTNAPAPGYKLDWQVAYITS